MYPFCESLIFTMSIPYFSTLLSSVLEQLAEIASGEVPFAKMIGSYITSLMREVVDCT
jgi:hypothetical protein